MSAGCSGSHGCRESLVGVLRWGSRRRTPRRRRLWAEDEGHLPPVALTLCHGCFGYDHTDVPSYDSKQPIPEHLLRCCPQNHEIQGRLSFECLCEETEADTEKSDSRHGTGDLNAATGYEVARFERHPFHMAVRLSAKRTSESSILLCPLSSLASKVSASYYQIRIMDGTGPTGHKLDTFLSTVI